MDDLIIWQSHLFGKLESHICGFKFWNDVIRKVSVKFDLTLNYKYWFKYWFGLLTGQWRQQHIWVAHAAFSAAQFPQWNFPLRCSKPTRFSNGSKFDPWLLISGSTSLLRATGQPAFTQLTLFLSILMCSCIHTCRLQYIHTSWCVRRVIRHSALHQNSEWLCLFQ